MKRWWIIAFIVVAMVTTAVAIADVGGAGRAALKTRITVSPVYPSAALAAHREGSTIVCFYVDANGAVNDPIVLSSTHPDFESAALDAAQRTVYATHAEVEDNYTCLRYRFRL